MSRVDETKELDSRFVNRSSFFRMTEHVLWRRHLIRQDWIDIFNLLLVVYRLLLLASTMAVPE
jgi:hypothetical protein